MKRSSTTLFLECPNTVLPVPWTGIENVIANIQSAYQSPTREVAVASWQAFVASGDELEVIADPAPAPPQPDWQTLQNRILGGDLYFIFKRLTEASLAPNANTISTARGDITNAIITVRIEAALASGLQLLTQVGGYVFSPEEKALWQSAVDELHFSSLVYLP
jgi:hypothetical protein